jgi:hypothetical protein
LAAASLAACAVRAHKPVIAAQDSRSSRSTAIAASSLRHSASQSSPSVSVIAHALPLSPSALL